jgi:pimeloyl-ACP methyl ester carboxylesterase
VLDVGESGCEAARMGSPGIGVRRRILLAGVVVLAVASTVAGCAAAPASGTTASETPAGAAAATAEREGMVEIGDGRLMHLRCSGTGSPTVVLVSGLRGAGDYWNSSVPGTTPVFDTVAAHTRVCEYDRPGTVRAGNAFGLSDAAPQPTTPAAGAADLEALLEASGERGPFVLAAHSYGGMIARMFASEHPQQVAGLVLIDALSERFADALGADDYAAWVASSAVSADDLAEYPAIERMDEDASFAQMRDSGPLPSVPLVVLSADVRYGPLWPGMIAAGRLPPGTPPDLGYAIDRAQRSSQLYQAGLLPGATHISSTHSGHDIPVQNPDLVTRSILDVVG